MSAPRIAVSTHRARRPVDDRPGQVVPRIGERQKASGFVTRNLRERRLIFPCFLLVEASSLIYNGRIVGPLPRSRRQTFAARSTLVPEQTRAASMIRPHVSPRALVVSSRIFRCGAACAVIAWILSAAAPAQAQNKFWVTAAGGSFASSTNWSTSAGGASGATPPAAGEFANFTLANTYTVGLGADVNNAGLFVSNGVVTLDLNSFGYTITGALGTTVGTVATQTGRLTIKDGILGVDTAGDDVAVGAAVGATGFLTISTGGRLGNGTLDPDVVIGSLGTGTLSFEDNGRADVALLNIGQGEGSIGTVTLDRSECGAGYQFGRHRGCEWDGNAYRPEFRHADDRHRRNGGRLSWRQG